MRFSPLRGYQPTTLGTMTEWYRHLKSTLSRRGMLLMRGRDLIKGNRKRENQWTHLLQHYIP